MWKFLNYRLIKNFATWEGAAKEFQTFHQTFHYVDDGVNNEATTKIKASFTKFTKVLLIVCIYTTSVS